MLFPYPKIITRLIVGKRHCRVLMVRQSTVNYQQLFN